MPSCTIKYPREIENQYIACQKLKLPSEERRLFNIWIMFKVSSTDRRHYRNNPCFYHVVCCGVLVAIPHVLEKLVVCYRDQSTVHVACSLCSMMIVVCRIDKDMWIHVYYKFRSYDSTFFHWFLFNLLAKFQNVNKLLTMVCKSWFREPSLVNLSVINLYLHKEYTS